MFVLAHLSDPHLGPLPTPNSLELLSKRGLGYLNWLRKRRVIHRPEVLAALTDDLKMRAPDHIAVTGDLVNLSLGNEFAPARGWLDRLGRPADVTLVPGNHDAYVRGAPELARRHWADYMQGDAGEPFPFVRRRGPLALVGLSSSLPTPPLAATGWLVGDQLARLGGILSALAHEKLFRVVLIHHSPIDGANYFRRLGDAGKLRAVLREHGAELVLHGHDHKASIAWIEGATGKIPVAGVPSASSAPGHHDDPAGYNLYEIGGTPGAWRCTAISRGLRDGGMVEVDRQILAGQ